MTTKPTNVTRAGRSAGGTGVVEPAREYVVDIPTVTGLWPFTLRTPQPTTGIPLGVDPNSGHLAGYDPHTAFCSGEQRAAQLAILAANGTGKSVLAKKLATGLAGQGIPTIVPFDAKNEYTTTIAALGGTTLTVNRTGGLNALDPGETIHHAHTTNTPPAVIAELEARRNQLLATLAGIGRGTPLTGWEQTALATAADLLPPGAVLADLATVITTQTGRLADTLATNTERAEELLEPLALDIAALANGPIGQALGTHHPDQHWDINQALVIDTSTILASEPQLTAAVIITCWTAALSAIHHHNHTTTSGAGGGGVFAVIFDEIWRATREFPALANQIGGLLRMDRNDGVISILATHSWTDTNQPGGSNILARCAAFAIGGMQNEEIDAIATAGIGLNTEELNEIRHNATAGTTTTGTAKGGTGRFLIKTGDHPGQLIQTILTPTEHTLYNTNQKWTGPPIEPSALAETQEAETANAASALADKIPGSIETSVVDTIDIPTRPIKESTDTTPTPISSHVTATPDAGPAPASRIPVTVETLDRLDIDPPTTPDPHDDYVDDAIDDAEHAVVVPLRRRPARADNADPVGDRAARSTLTPDNEESSLLVPIGGSLAAQLVNMAALNTFNINPATGVAVTVAITIAGLAGIWPHARPAFAPPPATATTAAAEALSPQGDTQ